MRRRGRHHQGPTVPEHVQERTHHGRSTTDDPADRAEGGMDQQGHPVRDADSHKVLTKTGFRSRLPLEIPCRHGDWAAPNFGRGQTA